ncbi:MAG: hypothetical protein R3B09_22665 [Nannocystaceae bacterium]
MSPRPRALPLFCSVDLAARIEAAESRMIAGAAEAAARRDPSLGAFARPLVGGVASYAGAASPLTKIAGLGFAGAPAEPELAAIEEALAVAGVAPRVELSSLGDPAIAALLGRRGYTLIAVEHVLGRPLDDAPAAAAEGLTIEPSPADALDPWLDLIITGFATPDGQGAGVDEEFPREGPPTRRCATSSPRPGSPPPRPRDGCPRAPQACGSTAKVISAARRDPAGHRQRRRGIRRSSDDRLARARAAGCTLAIVTTQPGSRSQENVQRQGFHLLYTRAILVRA